MDMKFYSTREKASGIHMNISTTITSADTVHNHQINEKG